MEKPMRPGVRKVVTAIAENTLAMLEVRGMSRGELGGIAKRAGTVSRETVYTMLNQKKPPKIEKVVALAELLGVEPWALMLTGLKNHKELVTPGALHGLEQVVENYLASTPAKRIEIEEAARVAARQSKLDK